jgi:hypothetical protein
LIGIPRGSKTTRRVSGFRGSASGEIMGCLVVGRSFGLHVSEVAAGMSGVSAAMRGLGKEASDYPRLLCGRQLAAKATPAPRSVRESVVRLPTLAFIRRPGENLLSICGRPRSGKGKRWGRCCAWSDAVICPAFDAAGRQPPACMGVRGPGPNHPQRARSTVESPGCPSPVSPTVAPYSPSARPHVLAIGSAYAAATGVL